MFVNDMQCRFCGQSISSDLDSHYKEEHEEVDHDILKILENDAKRAIELAKRRSVALSDVLDAERNLEDRQALQEGLRESMETSNKDIDTEKSISMLDTIRQKIQSIMTTQKETNQIKDKVQKKESEVDSLKATIYSLQAQKKALKNEIESYRENRSQYKDKVKSLEEDISELEEKEERLDSRLREYDEKKNMLYSKMKSLKEKIPSADRE